MTMPADQETMRIVRAFADLVRRRPTCITCIHFDEPTEVCGLYQARPPARVIAEGCERFIDAEVPF